MANELTTFVTAFSLPGTGVAEMMTVSPRFHIDGLMLACCDTGQCRQRLALAARAHDDHLLGWDALQVVRIDDVLVGDFQISQLASDIGVLHHGAAGDDHLAPVCHGGIADLLQAMDMRWRTTR